MAIKWSSIKSDEYRMWKWNTGVDLEADEKFINEMIAQGFTLARISGGGCWLTFAACQPGEYICRTAVTITDNGFFDKKKAASLEALLADEGAHIIPQTGTFGSRIGIFAVRATALGAFEINSDLDSRIAEYQVRRRYHEGMGTVWLCIGIVFTAAPMYQEVNAWSLVGVIWLVLGLIYLAPSFKYRKVINRLKAERDISEI
jgi:hypothetical protein